MSWPSQALCDPSVLRVQSRIATKTYQSDGLILQRFDVPHVTIESTILRRPADHGRESY